MPGGASASMSTSTAPPGADNDDKMATATVKRKATDATKNKTNRTGKKTQGGAGTLTGHGKSVRCLRCAGTHAPTTLRSGGWRYAPQSINLIKLIHETHLTTI